MFNSIISIYSTPYAPDFRPKMSLGHQTDAGPSQRANADSQPGRQRGAK